MRNRRTKYRVTNKIRFWVSTIIFITTIIILGILITSLWYRGMVPTENSEDSVEIFTPVESYPVIDILKDPFPLAYQVTTPVIQSTPAPTPTPTPTPTPEPVEGFVNKDGVNVRSIPGMDGEIVDVLNTGHELSIIGNVGEWVQCIFDGELYYISNQFVTYGKYVKPTPTPTPRYGKWTREEYLLLSTLIYCEADVRGGLQEAVAVGWVVRNRLEDKEEWGDDTWYDVISRGNGSQFSVFSKSSSSKFQKTLKRISNPTNEHMKTSKRAARYVMQGREKYKIPSTVQYFCSSSYYNRVKKSNGNWGSHKFYKQIGDTCFFYK